jgi:hypothetical protein
MCDIPTTKSEAELAQVIEARLVPLCFARSGSKKKFIWRKGVYWAIFASLSVSGGVAHLEVWNTIPYPGLGSFIMYFRNKGKLDSILAEAQAAVSRADTASDVDGGTALDEAIPVPPSLSPKKTVSGFAKVWTIFWIVGNIGSVLASIQNVTDSRLPVLGAVVMLMSAIVVVGYFFLLYRKPYGLYLVIGANALALIIASPAIRSGSVMMTTGLVIGVISFFVTKSQIEYPFVGKKSAVEEVDAGGGK